MCAKKVVSLSGRLRIRVTIKVLFLCDVWRLASAEHNNWIPAPQEDDYLC